MATSATARLGHGDPPQPAGPRWKRILTLIRDPLRYLLDVAEAGGVVMLASHKRYLVSDPAGVKHVLQDNHPNYTKGARYRNALEPLFGAGLLTSEGDIWKRQRRMIQPVFQRRRHDQFAAAMADCARAAIERWKPAAAAGTALDFRDEMIRLTLAILMRSVFGRDSGAGIEELGEAFLAAQKELNIAAAFSPVRLPKGVPTPGRRRFSRAVEQIDMFIARMVAEARLHPAREDNLLSLLLDARDDETGTTMTDRQLRDEIVTMLAAGHDTVAEALTWTFYLLCGHPEEQIRAAESDDYADMVVQESMRLYPPIWGFMRTAREADTIGGFRIPAGAEVIISPYVLHRSPRLWERPQEFRPWRFEPAQSATRHRFAYFPFSGGPRQCIGGGFAELEMRTVVALVTRAYELSLVPGQNIRPLPRVSLKPDRPVWVRLRERGG